MVFTWTTDYLKSSAEAVYRNGQSKRMHINVHPCLQLGVVNLLWVRCGERFICRNLLRQQHQSQRLEEADEEGLLCAGNGS